MYISTGFPPLLTTGRFRRGGDKSVDAAPDDAFISASGMAIVELLSRVITSSLVRCFLMIDKSNSRFSIFKSVPGHFAELVWTVL